MSSKPLRLFIAIELSPAVKQALGGLQADLKRRLPPRVVRWTNPDGIHLTLKFLGDTPEEKAQAVTQGVLAAAAGFEPFALRVAGLGCFPSPQRARVLWVGVPDMPKALAGVQRAIDLQMARLDFAREARPFSPHLTLGRVNDRISPAERQTLAGLLERTEAGELGVVPVEEIVLFQSELRPDGAVYTALARARLATASPS
ncbi:MAG: RNA 2',3'-cyclic phosphodiesterase [Anaerolineae bacterium]